MAVQKPLIRYPSGDGFQEVQLGVSDISGTTTLVVGPTSVTDGHLAVFDGTTGKLVKDGGAVPTGTYGVPRVLSTDINIPAGYSYVIVGPLETNGYLFSLGGSGSILGVI